MLTLDRTCNSTAPTRSSTTSPSSCRRARGSASSARTAPASRRCSGCRRARGARRGTVRRSPPSLAVGYLAQERDTGARSGGEETRAALAAVLREEFDVLLLDEPTNDLDFAGLELARAALCGAAGSLVVVSHDRAFLDRTVTRIVELDEWTRSATEYAGGWSEYEAERERAARAALPSAGTRRSTERKRIEEQQRRMAEWERRGYGQGRKKKKSKDVKRTYAAKLEQVETVEKPYEPWELQLGSRPRRAAATSSCASRARSSSAARSGSARSTSR